MEIFQPRNTLYPMLQPEYMTTLLMPCHKVHHGCALLYPLVMVTFEHQYGGSLCHPYCREETHPSRIPPTHFLHRDDLHSRVSPTLLSSPIQQSLRMSPYRLLRKFIIQSESICLSGTSHVLIHFAKKLQA